LHILSSPFYTFISATKQHNNLRKWYQIIPSKMRVGQFDNRIFTFALNDPGLNQTFVENGGKKRWAKYQATLAQRYLYRR
jgi:hypothetical protein